MKTWIRPGLSVAGALLGIFLYVAPSHAQATRTWVSGVGDDAFPCSRTAPCKTFAGAIIKTAANGMINVLDPGSYGALTITKSITVDATGNFAGVLATLGSSGIIVNALSTDVVVLKGLTIDGANTGGNGIRLLAAGVLHIENCVVNGFAQRGIDIQPSTATFLFIKDTVVRNNTAGGAANGGGILLKPSGGGSVRAEFNRVLSERNVYGLRAENNTETSIRDSVFAGSNAAVGLGINAVSTAGGNVQINIEDSLVTNNSSHGITANGLNAIVRATNVTVTNNSGTGINPTASGQVLSFGTNRIAGNAPDGAFTVSGLGEL
jgi:hypothetical protein